MDDQVGKLVPRIFLNPEKHVQPAFARLLLGKADLYVKVALSLKIVLDVARPFVQQVVIDRIFFKDRDQLFHQSPAQFGAFYFNVHGRSAGNIEGVIQAIVLSMVHPLGQGHLGFQTVLFLQALAQALQRPGSLACGHKVSGA